MFKTGVITDEISQDLRVAAALAAEYGLDGLEIRSVNDKGPFEFTKKDVQEIKLIARDKGLEITALSSPFFKCSLDDEREIQNHVEGLKRCLEWCKILETNLVRGFCFWKQGELDEHLSKIAGKFEKVVRLLEDNGVTMVLEADPAVFASNSTTLVKVLKAVNHQNIMGLYDPGNYVHDPLEESPFPLGYELLKPYIRHMHLKDATKLSDGSIEGTPIGQGDVDYVGLFRQLITDEYKGYIVLEPHYRPKSKFTHEELALPGGLEFSEQGYQGTVECLIAWKELMRKVGRECRF